MILLPETAVRAALAKAEGNVTWAAAKFGVQRGELWDYIARRPTLSSFLTDLREGMVDSAESYLREANAAGKPWAITFILTTLGKNGVTDKNHPARAQKGEPPSLLSMPPDIAKLNTEQIVKLLDLVAKARSEFGTTPEPEFMQRLDHAGEAGEPAGAGVRKALTKFAGDVTRAAKLLGVTRAELMEYLTRRPELQDAANDVREEIVDHAETELRTAVREKKPWAIRFVLKTLGGCRGYSDNSSSSDLQVPSSSSSSELRVPSSELKNADSGARQLGKVAGGALADVASANQVEPSKQADKQIESSLAAREQEKQGALTGSGGAGDSAYRAQIRAEMKERGTLPRQGRDIRAEMKTNGTLPPRGRESQTEEGETIPTQNMDEAKAIATLPLAFHGEGGVGVKAPAHHSIDTVEDQGPPRTVPRPEPSPSRRGADIPVCQIPGGPQRPSHGLPPPKSG